MLAALLANLNTGARDGHDAPRRLTDKQRKKYLAALRKQHAERAEEWRLKREAKLEFRHQLQIAYDALTASPQAAQVAELVKPHVSEIQAIHTEPITSIDWEAFALDLSRTQSLLALYHDVLDEELLLLVI